MNRRIELLAPAGSFETMKACYSAGADAVYMGLSRFSARAYAENAAADDFVAAIHYAHLRGKKLYCTVNTLFKENELKNELYGTLKPLYEAGLDAVIVQDLGVMKFISEHFPLLPIHVSTQATVTGPGAVRFLKRFHVTRVVPSRELSLQELRRIYDDTGIEIESFIHGALCYCYSGQCLFSSVVGGRSGNRGRCAQPCRMGYSVSDENGNALNKKDEAYVLSMKDLSTLRFLPEIIEAGVVSLKIEGRMKKVEYAAGVTSIYRKYLDLYLQNDAPYRVDPADEQKLLNLFNREGFTEGYYRKSNGREMIALHEKEFREEDRDFLEFVRKNYLDTTLKKAVSGAFSVETGKPAALTLKAEFDGFSCEGSAVSLDPVPAALSKPLTKAEISARLSKLGDTPFTMDSLSGTVSPDAFLPVSVLNNLRREASERLSEAILQKFRRCV